MEQLFNAFGWFKTIPKVKQAVELVRFNSGGVIFVVPIRTEIQVDTK